MRLFWNISLALALLGAGVSTASAQCAPSGSNAGTPTTVAQMNGASGPLIRNADNGSTITVAVGQTVTVALMADTGMQLWQLTPPDPTVLQAVPNPAAAALRGETLASFQAVGDGTTDIVATSDCPDPASCAQPEETYDVTVVVTDSGS